MQLLQEYRVEIVHNVQCECEDSEHLRMHFCVQWVMNGEGCHLAIENSNLNLDRERPVTVERFTEIVVSCRG